MAACTFFGHRDCPNSIRKKLRTTIVEWIEVHSVDTFYVGCQGNYDKIVRSVLRELQSCYPRITYAVVLDHIPVPKGESDTRDFSDTILPEGIEQSLPRFAIVWRNKWMLAHSDFVVSYITHSWGSAAKFSRLGAQQNKVVINLA